MPLWRCASAGPIFAPRRPNSRLFYVLRRQGSCFDAHSLAHHRPQAAPLPKSNFASCACRALPPGFLSSVPNGATPPPNGTSSPSNGAAASGASYPAAAASQPDAPFEVPNLAYMTDRHKMVLSHFSTALGVDDFISRLEIALFGYGFTGENSIAMTNLCRCGVKASSPHLVVACLFPTQQQQPSLIILLRLSYPNVFVNAMTNLAGAVAALISASVCMIVTSLS